MVNRYVSDNGMVWRTKDKSLADLIMKDHEKRESKMQKHKQKTERRNATDSDNSIDAPDTILKKRTE